MGRCWAQCCVTTVLVIKCSAFAELRLALCLVRACAQTRAASLCTCCGLQVWGWRSTFICLTVAAGAIIFPMLMLVVPETHQVGALHTVPYGCLLRAACPHLAHKTQHSACDRHPPVCLTVSCTRLAVGLQTHCVHVKWI